MGSAPAPAGAWSPLQATRREHCPSQPASEFQVSELANRLDAEGFHVAHPAGKTISDALSWEVGRRRAVRVGRGRYQVGTMPKQTRSRIRRRVAALRAEAAAARWPPPAAALARERPRRAGGAVIR